jgi:hypothetical protein
VWNLPQAQGLLARVWNLPQAQGLLAQAGNLPQAQGLLAQAGNLLAQAQVLETTLAAPSQPVSLSCLSLQEPHEKSMV